MSNSFILVNRQNPSITVMTLNRPEKRNALNIALIEEFCSIYSETEQLTSQRVMIIRAEGPHFCAGLDLNEAADPELVDKSGSLLAKLFKTIYDSPLISIAAVQGSALAGGAGIVTACDIALANKDSHFGYPEVHRGLVAAQVSTLLRRQIVMRHVRELLLLGELIDAQRALEIGLINRVVEADELFLKALEMAASILKGTPKAVIETKRLLTNLELISLEDDLNIAMEAHHRARLSEEAKESINAFLGRSSNGETKEGPKKA